MTLPEVTQMLRLLSNLWPQHKISDDVIAAWHFALETEDSKLMMLATRHVMKNHKSEFFPSIGVIFEAVRQFKEPEETADEAWLSKGMGSEIAAEAWEKWGGDKRWGALPDPAYSSNPTEANRAIGYAMLEFKDVYKSVASRKKITANRHLLENEQKRIES